MFPGYVIVKMLMTDESWYVVRNTRGVTGFVGPGSKPVALSEEEVITMGIELTEPKIANKYIDLEIGGYCRSYLMDHLEGLVGTVTRN